MYMYIYVYMWDNIILSCKIAKGEQQFHFILAPDHKKHSGANEVSFQQ